MSKIVLPPTPAQVEDARRVIADHLRVTPVLDFSLRGRSVLAKMESFQHTGSFKSRGALAAVAAAQRENPDGAVIASSAGNHGLGIAYAASVLGVRATVVVPGNASAVKVKKLQSYDIELIQVGSSYDDAQNEAWDLAESRGIRYLSPFNDTHVIAGQSTVFYEMFKQCPDLEHVVVSVGGGGLISSAVLAREIMGRHDIRITGVQPQRSAAMYHVLRGVKMADVVHDDTIADGLAGGGDDDAVTTEIIAQHGISIVLVPEVNIRSAVREAAESNGVVMEGSASAAYAAITENLVDDTDSRLGFVVSGRNIAHDLFAKILNETTL